MNKVKDILAFTILLSPLILWVIFVAYLMYTVPEFRIVMLSLSAFAIGVVWAIFRVSEKERLRLKRTQLGLDRLKATVKKLTSLSKP